ncbi:MAG: hypothetical protein QF682_12715 [Candidatus Thermoplasmatota archaeon]|nr:hypothetical protein [Candidatus Thermoplasmatota archaeon]
METTHEPTQNPPGHPCPKLDTRHEGGCASMTDEKNLPELPEGWVWARELELLNAE